MRAPYFLLPVAAVIAVQITGQPPQTQPSALKIIRENCVKCHSGDKAPNGLKLDTVDNMVRGGKRGPAVVPFKPFDSLIYKAIAGTGEEIPMMPPFRRLEENEAATIRRWIYQGAQQISMGGQEP
jgi:hypothetical protein